MTGRTHDLAAVTALGAALIIYPLPNITLSTALIAILAAALICWLARLLLEFLHPIMPHTDITLVWYAFVIGVASHLVMDTFTKEGVPWLLPLPFKFGIPPVKDLRVTTG